MKEPLFFICMGKVDMKKSSVLLLFISDLCSVYKILFFYFYINIFFLHSVSVGLLPAMILSVAHRAIRAVRGRCGPGNGSAGVN